MELEPNAGQRGVRAITGQFKSANLSQTRPRIVAVDGPAGSGKSSICHRVSERVGWNYLNTGAIYRAVGLLVLESGLSLDDDAAIAAQVDRLAGDLRWESDTKQIWYRDRNMSGSLHTEEAGYAASKVARLPKVRERLLPVQRQICLSAPLGVLVDGRDIGTVVFPDADLKIFLTASLEERSRRRMQQLSPDERAEEGGLEDVMRGLAKRDLRDEGRDVAPLKQAADAVVLDTSHLDLDQTIEAMISILRERGLIP